MVLAALYSHYALRVATWQNDEELYTRLARHIASAFPAALWQGGIWTRGLQRLDPLLLAAPFAFLRGPGAFEVGHVLECIVFCSTAVPVFLLARRSGLPRAYSYMATLLSVVVPWAIVSTSFLSESVAYPAFAWVLYAVWLATCEPSTRHEVAALGALAIAPFARTALLALAPMLPLSVLFQTLRCELEGVPWRTRLTELPRRLWAAHRIVTALTLAVVALYLLSRLGVVLGNESTRLTGSYGVPHLEGVSGLSSRYRYFFSRAVAGTGFVASAFAIGWVLQALVSARDARVHGLAVVLVASVLCLMLTLLEAGPDERYVMYAAIPVALGFMWALRQRVGWPVLIGERAVVLLTASVCLAPTREHLRLLHLSRSHVLWASGPQPRRAAAARPSVPRTHRRWSPGRDRAGVDRRRSVPANTAAGWWRSCRPGYSSSPPRRRSTRCAVRCHGGERTVCQPSVRGSTVTCRRTPASRRSARPGDSPSASSRSGAKPTSGTPRSTVTCGSKRPVRCGRHWAYPRTKRRFSREAACCSRQWRIR